MSIAKLTCETQEKWEAWLECNGGTSPGMWLRLARKGAGQATVTYAEALERGSG